MKKLLLNTVIAGALLCSAPAATAGCLWIMGDATPYGWSLDDATALLSEPSTPDIYTGTIYLKADQDFKFLTTTDWGNLEYGAKEGATLTDGKIELASGIEDSGYAKIKVSESANYLLTVDLADLTATITKSAYQDSEIKLCSLFIVGDPTEGGWSVDNGTPLYQNPEAPYCYGATKLALKEGTFKIATVIKGGGTWDNKYWYFRDADDANKMVLNQDGDIQWRIEKAGNYNIETNLNTLAISITEDTSTGVDAIEAETAETPVYYNLSGVRVENPAHGFYICRQGKRATKVFID